MTMSAAIVRLMGKLRTHPRTCIQHPSLGRIVNYVGGYVWARVGAGIKGEMDLLLDFDEWLRLLFATGWHGNAESIISLYADDDAHAVKMHFQLFDDFVVGSSTAEARDRIPLRRSIRGSTEHWPRHNLSDLLRELRKSPAMYVGQRSLIRVMAFIRGFIAAQSEMGLIEGQTMRADLDAWVRKRFSMHAEHDAESVITFHSMEDHRALPAFWTLYDEFLEQRTAPQSTN